MRVFFRQPRRENRIAKSNFKGKMGAKRKGHDRRLKILTGSVCLKPAISTSSEQALCPQMEAYDYSNYYYNDYYHEFDYNYDY